MTKIWRQDHSSMVVRGLSFETFLGARKMEQISIVQGHQEGF